MKLAFLYTTSGVVLFGWLFIRFLRKGSADTNRDKWDEFFLHGLDVRRKLWSDPAYLVHFAALMIGLMSFAASVVFLLEHFVQGPK